MAQTVTIPLIELENLKAEIAAFHAVKGIRAWAAEENAVTKRAALARVDAMIVRADRIAA